MALTAPGISRSCSSSANLRLANASRTSTWHVSRDAASRKPPASRPASCAGVRICNPSAFCSAARKRSSCQARRPGTTMVLRVIQIPRWSMKARIVLDDYSLSRQDVPCERIEWPFQGPPRTLSKAEQLSYPSGPDRPCNEQRYCAQPSEEHVGAAPRWPTNLQKFGPVCLDLVLATGATQYLTPKLWREFDKEELAATEARYPASELSMPPRQKP